MSRPPFPPPPPRPRGPSTTRQIVIGVLVTIVGLAVMAVVVLAMILGPWIIAARQEDDAHDDPPAYPRPAAVAVAGEQNPPPALAE